MNTEPIDGALVGRLAELAGLSVDAARAERLAGLLARLLTQMDDLRDIDLEGVEPTLEIDPEDG